MGSGGSGTSLISLFTGESVTYPLASQCIWLEEQAGVVERLQGALASALQNLLAEASCFFLQLLTSDQREHRGKGGSCNRSRFLLAANCNATIC